MGLTFHQKAIKRDHQGREIDRRSLKAAASTRSESKTRAAGTLTNSNRSFLQSLGLQVLV